MSEPVKPAPEEPGRRSLLGMLGAFAALTLLVSTLSLGFGAPRPKRPILERPDPESTAFLGPLAEGARFGGWHVSRVDPVRHGALTLELTSEREERFVVDVRARSDAAPPGIAETARLALYVRSSGKTSETPEPYARACAALAAALRAREASGHAPPALESLEPAPQPATSGSPGP
jgi:hypothetical protein